MTAARTRIKLSRPGDVLGVVPYLVGFHPRESVVALMVRSRRVVLTIRVNMPPPAEATDLAADIAGLADQHSADELIIIGYSADAEAARGLLSRVEGELDGYHVNDVLYVDGQRWWSLTCTGTCCPPEGRPYDPGCDPIAAEAVYAGLEARADRAELEKDVGGPPEAERGELRRLAEQQVTEIQPLDLRARCALMEKLVLAGAANDLTLDDANCLRIAVLARDVPVRDVAWALIRRETAEQHLALWSRVVARTAAPYEAAPLCLLGFCAWICGNGAMMNCCIERLSTVAPAYSMGHLLNKISRRALPPSLWDQMDTQIRAELSLIAK